MLTKLVENKDTEIVCLALGVLVNVCYKNLPAIYTLSRIVDIKTFLRYCLPMRVSFILFFYIHYNDDLNIDS